MGLELSKKSKCIVLCFGVVCITACRQSQEPESMFSNTSGTIEATISTNQISFIDGSLKTKTVLLNRIIVSHAFLERQLKTAEILNPSEKPDYLDIVIPFKNSAGAVDLGMANVPVLDQGANGTCVTFATTAILDAILNQGDLISQQCILGLTKGFGKDYWDGAQNALQILKPLRENGIVEQNRCSSQYPNTEVKITVSEYQNISSKTFHVMSVVGHFVEPITLDIVRRAIDNKHRIAFGFGLRHDHTSVSVVGFDTKINNYNTIGGLWACTRAGSSANYCGMPNAGHEVVIIGYDDKQKLLKVRNSWGDFVGDNGDFYMTYHFFQMMGFNGTEIY